MQIVPAIHGGDPDPTAALPQEAGGGRVWGGPVDCGGERPSVPHLQFYHITPVVLCFGFRGDVLIPQ